MATENTDERRICTRYMMTEKGMALNAAIETLAVLLHRDKYGGGWHKETHENRQFYREVAQGLKDIP